MQMIYFSGFIFKLAYSKIKIPLDAICGNHDNANGKNKNVFKMFFPSGLRYRDVGNYCFLSIDWGITVSDFARYDKLIKLKYNKKIILLTHEYIDKDCNLIREGINIYSKLVEPNSNVFMILCGHVWTHGRAFNQRTIGERKVYEIMRCFHDYPTEGKSYGGNGYFCIINLNEKKISGRTYSPVTKSYLDDDDFEINL